MFCLAKASHLSRTFTERLYFDTSFVPKLFQSRHAVHLYRHSDTWVRFESVDLEPIPHHTHSDGSPDRLLKTSVYQQL